MAAVPSPAWPRGSRPTGRSTAPTASTTDLPATGDRKVLLGGFRRDDKPPSSRRNGGTVS
ncbi:unnamed protein product [Ixodes pacificus]